jgi:hypothetical protein
VNFTISENHVELETRMSLQKLLNPTRKMEDVFFRLQSQCSPAGNDSSEWVEVDSLVVELDHDSELHGKHYFTIPEEIRECPSLRMVVQTNSTVPAHSPFPSFAPSFFFFAFAFLPSFSFFATPANEETTWLADLSVFWARAHVEEADSDAAAVYPAQGSGQGRDHAGPAHPRGRLRHHHLGPASPHRGCAARVLLGRGYVPCHYGSYYKF